MSSGESDIPIYKDIEFVATSLQHEKTKVKVLKQSLENEKTKVEALNHSFEILQILLILLLVVLLVVGYLVYAWKRQVRAALSSSMAVDRMSKKHGRNKMKGDKSLAVPLINSGVSSRDARFVTSVVAVATIGSFLYGYVICVLNTCGAPMAVVLKWCGNEWQSDCSVSIFNQSIANSSLFLGATLGAFLFARPGVQEVGVRKALCLSDMFFIAGSLLCCAAEDFVMLTVGRCIVGVGLGLCGVSTPLFIAQMAPSHRRGAFSAMYQVGISLGILVSIAMGLPQSPVPTSDAEGPLTGLDTWWWRWLLGFPAILAAVQLMCFSWFFPFDTPAQLVKNGSTEEAEKILLKIYANDAVGLERERLARQALMDLTCAVQEASQAPNIALVDALMDPFFKTALLLGVFLAMLQQLCGINALMSYSNLLFSRAGVAPENLTMVSTTMAIANVGVSLGASSLLDGWGRRTLFLFGVGLQTVMMWALYTIQVPTLTAVCFTVFVMAFAMGLGPVTWLYLSEIYPEEIRGKALSFCQVCKWLACFAVVFGAPLLNLTDVYAVFGSICLLGFMVIYVFVLETKGCSMDDSPLTPRSSRSNSAILSPRSPRSPQEHSPRDPQLTGSNNFQEIRI